MPYLPELSSSNYESTEDEVDDSSERSIESTSPVPDKGEDAEAIEQQALQQPQSRYPLTEGHYTAAPEQQAIQSRPEGDLATLYTPNRHIVGITTTSTRIFEEEIIVTESQNALQQETTRFQNSDLNEEEQEGSPKALLPTSPTSDSKSYSTPQLLQKTLSIRPSPDIRRKLFPSSQREHRTPASIQSESDLQQSSFKLPSIHSIVESQGFTWTEAPISSHEPQWMKRGTCYIYATEYHNAFVQHHRQWWNDYGSQQYTKYNASPINWGNTDQRQSVAWPHFDEGIETTTGAPKVICKVCLTKLVHPGLGGGISSMTDHLKSIACKSRGRKRGMDVDAVEKSVIEHARKKKKDTTESVTKTNAVETDFGRCQTEMIVQKGLPLTFFESDVVQQSYRSVAGNSKLRFYSSTTQRKNIEAIAREAERQIAKALESANRVSIAIDEWSARTIKHSFLAVKVYWIDHKWVYHEELLSFPVVEGKHSGVNFAELVKKTIRLYNIGEKLTSVTTDNAGSNQTLYREVQSAIHDLEQDALVQVYSSAEEGTIQDKANREGHSTGVAYDEAEETLGHLPCLAHVFQLAIKDLYGKLRIAATNDDFIKLWNEETSKAEVDRLKKDKQLHGIPYLLAKIRAATINVNASDTRQNEFRRIQAALIEEKSIGGDGQPLKNILRLLQDVKTRWDSTTIMLVRFRKLRPAIDQYLEHQGYSWLELSKTEWAQLNYLIDISRPFALCTSLIGQTKGPSIYLVYGFYNTIFDLIDDSKRKLKKKRVAWKKTILVALKAAEDKLLKYYEKTKSHIGDLYGMAVLLHPYLKDSFWESSSWGTDRSWVKRYWKKLEQLWRAKYAVQAALVATGQDDSTATHSANTKFSVSSFITRNHPKSEKNKGSTKVQSEFEIYRNSDFSHLYGQFDDNVLLMWKSIEKTFPTIALLARDILCIPAASVGVERTFSIARHQLRFNRNYSPAVFSNIIIAKHRLHEQRRDTIIAEELHDTDGIEGNEAVIEYKETLQEIEEILELDAISENDEGS